MAQTNVSLEPDKLRVVLSICKFLTQEIGSCLSSDVQESLTVALQCLEAAYGINYESLVNTVSDIPDLWHALAPVGDKAVFEAETYKQKGNELMSVDRCKEAIDSYTRAIELNPQNAVYYCNRAAAYCRLENYAASVADCETAVKLDANYSKAYGRLGFAYLSMNSHAEAAEAYATALRLDPGNEMYKQNFEIAMDRFRAGKSRGHGSSANIPPTSSSANQTQDRWPTVTPADMESAVSQIVNNPNLLNMASAMLGDEALRNAMTELIQMRTQGPGNPSMENVILMGQQLAQQMQNERPDFIELLRRQFTDDGPTNQSANNNSSSNKQNDKNPPSGPPGNA